MSDDQDHPSNHKTKTAPTPVKAGSVGAASTNIPPQLSPDTQHSGHPVLAEDGGTSVVDAGLETGQVLPFESQVQGHIGRQLRAVYDEVLHQPIPERFLELLKELDEHSSET